MYPKLSEVCARKTTFSLKFASGILQIYYVPAYSRVRDHYIHSQVSKAVNRQDHAARDLRKRFPLAYDERVSSARAFLHTRKTKKKLHQTVLLLHENDDFSSSTSNFSGSFHTPALIPVFPMVLLYVWPLP